MEIDKTKIENPGMVDIETKPSKGLDEPFEGLPEG